MNRAAFFNSIRQSLFGRLSQSQVEGMEAILDYWDTKAEYRKQPNALAYILATTYHETARTMQPIVERGGRNYFKKYDTGRLARNLGNTPEADGDGFKFRGRGFVQITGFENYKRASEKLNIDFISNPEQALDLNVATVILVRGCMEGWFTGKSIPAYITDRRADYIHARKVVNRMDKARLIAGYAEEFELALTLGRKTPKQKEEVIEVSGKPMVRSTTAQATAGSMLTTGAGVLAAFNGYDAKQILALVFAGVVCFGCYVIYERYKKSRDYGV